MSASYTALLAMMDREQFGNFVGERLGPEEPAALWSALLAPAVLPRTEEALIRIQEQTNDLLEARKEALRTLQLETITEGEEALGAYTAAKREYDGWARRTKAYRRLLNNRIRQTRAVKQRHRKEAHEQHQAHNRDRHRVIASKLALAVHKHKATSIDLDIKPEPHDRELWRLIDELTIQTNRRDLTLTEAIEYGHWTAEDDGEVSE